MLPIAFDSRISRIAVALLVVFAAIGPWSPAASPRPVRATEEGVPDHYAALVGESMIVDAPGFTANDVPDGTLENCSLDLSAASTLPPGDLSMGSGGRFTFTPRDAAFNGSGSFQYSCRVAKNGVTDHTYTAVVTLYFVNSLTVDAVDDEYFIGAGDTLTLDPPGVLDNDVSELPVTLTAGQSNVGGPLVLSNDGSLSYKPQLQSGTANFRYTLTNAVGTSDTARVSVNVLGALTLADDAYTTRRNTPLIVPAPGVIDNDPSKNSIFGVVISSAPTSGTATVFGGLGGIKYTPDTDFAGTDSFTYAVTDALGRIKTATVTVNVGDPTVTLSRTRATVNTLVRYTLANFKPNANIEVFWIRGNTSITLPSVVTDGQGKATGSFKIPATVGGTGQRVRFRQAGVPTEVPFEIIPRIKVLTDPAQRGQTVNVSLRGYAKGETVRIRWKNGSRFVQLASVKTSSTGSANVNIVVPAFAVDGEHTVRGDGTAFRSETKVVTVLGGPSAAEVVEPTSTATPSPVPTATETVSPTATPVPTATQVATEEATAEPTVEPTPPAEATLEPTAEPSVESTQEPPIEPSAEPSVEPTSVRVPDAPDEAESPAMSSPNPTPAE